jgi:heme exporter protein B
LKKFILLFKNSLKNDFANPERVISPIIFSLLVVVLFSFGFEGLSDASTFKFFCAETYLILFFAVQLSFSRLFEVDMQDGAFHEVRRRITNSNSLFLAKYLNVIIHGFLILIPTAIFAGMLHLGSFQYVFESVVIALLAMLGIASLGVLLSTLLIKSPAKQILFPLIYFPLCVPVLLAAINGTHALVDLSAPTEKYLQSWVILLVCFDIVYITLSMLLFSELIKVTPIDITTKRN